jgi:thiamine-monophosphate kinase
VNELELIRRLLPHLARAGGGLVIGPGEDDAAAWRERDGSYTVATCDTSVEGVHFDLARQHPRDVGWRALAFALGDLAAKGARPTYGLASISIPPGWAPDAVEGIYEGMALLAAETHLLLVGGDTTSTPSHGSLALTLLGTTTVRPLPRSAARPGWAVGVTGPLGGAGLHWTRPRPRLEEGAWLNAAGLACGDISDGLRRELDKFQAAAGVGAILELDAVPCVEGVSPLEAITSGEEVELVCAGPPPLPGGLQVVGRLTGDGAVRVIDAAGSEIQVTERGYDHFA